MTTLVSRIVRSNIALAQSVAAIRRLRFGRPACGMVAMFHIGRCGSTVLASLLEQDPRIHWGGELFHNVRKSTPGYIPAPRWVRSVIELSAYRDVRDYYGFETKAIHFTADCLGMSVAQYVELLADIGFGHFIILTRKNLLRVVISALVGYAKQTWHAAVTPPGPTRITIDIDNPWGNGAGSLIQTFEAYERFYCMLEVPLRNRCRLDLDYELDIERAPAVAYGKVCAFLNIPALPIEVQLARTNPFPLGDIVTNYDNVVAALRGTRFEWMLTA